MPDRLSGDRHQRFSVLRCPFPVVRFPFPVVRVEVASRAVRLLEGSLRATRRWANYASAMKFLIIAAVLAALAGIAYKVLTTEIPIDES